MVKSVLQENGGLGFGARQLRNSSSRIAGEPSTAGNTGIDSPVRSSVDANEDVRGMPFHLRRQSLKR
jgi:hypothetical protein